MAKFEWKNGVLVQNAKVQIDGQLYDVTPEQYEGETPLSAQNLNAMQDGIYEDMITIGTCTDEELAEAIANSD